MRLKGNVITRGLDVVGQRMDRRCKLLRNLEWLGKEHGEYTMEKRIPQMFQHGGRVPGRWGAGYTLWAKNSAWVRRAKADRRVFFKHGRRRSSLEDTFVYRSWTRGRTLAMRLENTAKPVKYLEKGFARKRIRARRAKCLAIPYGFGQVVLVKSAMRGKMPPRQIQGFREGDLKRLAFYAAKRLVTLREAK